MSTQNYTVYQEFPKEVVLTERLSIEGNISRDLVYTISTEAHYELIHSPGVSAIVATILSLLTLGCILGNGLVILAVLTVHKLKTPSNYLIVSLAVSDILVGLIVMPLAILVELLGNKWPLGPAACDMWVTFDVMSCTASILNLMMISIDRYLVIMRPLRYSLRRTTTLIMLYIVIAWLVSLLISVTPMMVGWKPKYVDGSCQISDKLGYQIYATFGAFYLPLGVMIALYGRIFIISSRHAKAKAKNNSVSILHEARERQALTPMENSKVSENTCPTRELTMETELNGSTDNPTKVLSNGNHDHCNGERHHHNNNNIRPIVSKKKSITDLYHKIVAYGHQHMRRKSGGNRQAIKTLGVIMGLFTACWLPFFILAVVRSVLMHVCPTTCPEIPGWVTSLLTWLGWINSCLNPIIYARFNREFRTPFKEIICCRCQTINQIVRHTDYLDRYCN